MFSLIIAFIVCVLVSGLAVATFKYGGAAFGTNSDTSFENEREAIQAVTQEAAQLAQTMESTQPQGIKVVNIAWNPDNVRQTLKDAQRKYRNQ